MDWIIYVRYFRLFDREALHTLTTTYRKYIMYKNWRIANFISINLKTKILAVKMQFTKSKLLIVVWISRFKSQSSLTKFTRAIVDVLSEQTLTHTTDSYFYFWRILSLLWVHHVYGVICVAQRRSNIMFNVASEYSWGRIKATQLIASTFFGLYRGLPLDW